MVIKPGRYKIWYELSTDGGQTYPINFVQYGLLYISDSTLSGDIVNSSNNLTANGPEILSITGAAGFADVWNFAFHFSGSMPSDMEARRTYVINNAGVADISLSPSIDFQYVGADSSFLYRAYLDSAKTILLKEGTIGGSTTGKYVSRCQLVSGTYTVRIPVFRVNTALTTIYPSFISAYRTANTNRTELSRIDTADVQTVLAAFDGVEPAVETTDPYTPGDPGTDIGSSVPGGGTGTFSDTGDPIGIPGLPTLSAVDTGLITLFNPTAAQVKSLADYLWSSGFDLSTFKNIVANPMDCILGLTIIPATPTSSGSKSLVVGNIDTGLSFPALDTQYIEIDCGTLDVQEFWGSYLDYSPYTKMSLYLPYIGIVPLDIDDVMNASVHVVYHMDVLSGALVAYVQCNGTQLYTYIGQCSSNVPVTSNDFTNTVNGILGIAGNIGSLFATGGASAPTAISGMASNAINALKPNIQKSGAMSGTGGLMGVQIPYLLCSRPRQSVPANQNEFTGYPANITAQLSSLSGYTEVEKIHLEGIPCTSEEMEEILSLLESGVII